MPKLNLIQIFLNFIVNTKVKYQIKMANKCVARYNIARLDGKISCDLCRRKIVSAYFLLLRFFIYSGPIWDC